MKPYDVVALYHFAAMQDLESLQESLLARCRDNEVLGTLLLAEEGVNGTIAAPQKRQLQNIIDFLTALPGMADMDYKFSSASDRPFKRLKVKIKDEIVMMKKPGVKPAEQVGTYIAPEDWNDIVTDPDVVVIDTRNDFECEVGTFKNAVNPKTENFWEFPDFVKKHLNPEHNKKIAMFCTGGIRCEKASSYMLSEGFETVYHLKGGILKYLENVPEDKSLWDGECFVFDERVTLTHGLKEGDWGMCYGCGAMLSPEELKSKTYEEGISCDHCFDDLDDKARKSRADQHTHYLQERAKRAVS